MLQQWQQQYDFVGTYFINVGDNANPANGNSTNWSVSLPIYDQLLQMGNEIGSHSYTHLINPPTVDANGNPVPNIVVNTATGSQTVNSWSENTNTLYVTPPANGSAPNWTFAYEFGTGNSIMEQNIGIPIAGAAVPGAADTVATSDNIEQVLPDLGAARRRDRLCRGWLDRGRLRRPQCFWLHRPERYRVGLHRAEHHLRLHRNPIRQQNSRPGAGRLGVLVQSALGQLRDPDHRVAVA